MSVSDKSKGTVFITYCHNCKHEAKTTIENQRVKAPTACSFCRGDVIVETIQTFPRP